MDSRLRTALIISIAPVIAIGIGVGQLVTGSVGPEVDHVTLTESGSAGAAAAFCPQNPAAAAADLAAANPGLTESPGAVWHFHPAACTGETSTSSSTSPSTEPPPTEPTTTSSTSTSTTSTSSSTTTTEPATTSSTTTSSTSSTTTSSSTSTTTTSTTLPLPSTTSPGGSGQQFAASFATPDDFYSRFWTYVGNACNAAQTCEPCAAGVGICEFGGDHSMECSTPTTKRTVHVRNKPELFWWCAPNGPDTGHVMIGMNTSGYAISGFAPAQAFTDITSICWDQNLTDLGGGKWMVLTVIPVDAAVPDSVPGAANQPTSPIRLDVTLPEFDADNAPGDFNIQRAQRLQFKLFRNELRLFDRLGPFASPQAHRADWATTSGYIAGSDVATRYRMCLEETRDGIRVSQARPGTTVTWNTWSIQNSVVQPGIRFPDGPAYVIWADDTYDADKHGGTGLYTWHFDNVAIAYG